VNHEHVLSRLRALRAGTTLQQPHAAAAAASVLPAGFRVAVGRGRGGKRSDGRGRLRRGLLQAETRRQMRREGRC
jgi:hypothetical protein